MLSGKESPFLYCPAPNEHEQWYDILSGTRAFLRSWTLIWKPERGPKCEPIAADLKLLIWIFQSRHSVLPNWLPGYSHSTQDTTVLWQRMLSPRFSSEDTRQMFTEVQMSNFCLTDVMKIGLSCAHVLHRIVCSSNIIRVWLWSKPFEDPSKSDMMNGAMPIHVPNSTEFIIIFPQLAEVGSHCLRS